MKIRVKDVVYDATNIVDAPINLLIELNQATGMEGQDILDGIAAGAEAIMAGRAPTARALMASAALVWLGKRTAGEQVGFAEAVEGLSLLDIEPVADETRDAPGTEGAPDPTRPGSDPGTAAADQPAPAVASSPLPSQLLPPPSSSTDSPSSTSGPA